MIQWKQSKVGRNDSCPCGSGLKFKKCHGAQRPMSISDLPISELLQRGEVQERQRVKQQGLGRPIISAPLAGMRAVAVGDQLVFTKAKTFHEFLWEYIKTALGGDWGNKELAKSTADRHPLLNWYQQAAEYINSNIRERGKVQRIRATGIVSAYLRLAYNLYLIAHNKELQERLVDRLKQRDQFLPAWYETCVFATLIRSGFELEFEDETDSSRTHCEVTATFPRTGRKFSVEAKMRQKSTASLDIGRQIKKALRKKRLSTLELYSLRLTFQNCPIKIRRSNRSSRFSTTFASENRKRLGRTNRCLPRTLSSQIIHFCISRKNW